jgi:hypothetical protein
MGDGMTSDTHDSKLRAAYAGLGIGLLVTLAGVLVLGAAAPHLALILRVAIAAAAGAAARITYTRWAFARRRL